MSFSIFNRHHGPAAVDTAAKTSSAAKAAVNTIDKGMRSAGTSLKRGLRNAVKNFNGATLSAKVSPFDPDSLKRAKDYGSDAVRAQEQQAAQRMNQQRPQPPQHGHTQHTQEERKQYAAHWEREHAAPQPRAQARPAPQPRAQARPMPQPARQAPAPWQPGHREEFAAPPRYERATAEQMRRASMPIDYHTSEDDIRLIEQAQQQLRAIDERNQARRATHAQQPWKPAWDPGIARSDTHTLRQRDHFERVLAQPDHHGLSSSERKQLMAEQAHARSGLDKLTNTQAASNAGTARFERQTKLLSARARLDDRIAKLDPDHPDFDWAGMDRAPAQRESLSKERGRITEKLKELGYSDDD